MRTLQVCIGALHRAGIVLLDEDDQFGPGVRLKKGVKIKGNPPRKRTPKKA